jgi:release factor glutamine methyltransferase
VSNPPYIPISEKEWLATHVSRFEPERALFVPDDHPLLFYEALGLAAKNYLLPGGMLYLEINQAFGAATTSLLEQMDFQVTLRKDLQGNDRMIRAVKKN